MDTQESSVFEYQDLDPEVLEEISKLFNGPKQDQVRVGPKGYFVPKEFKKYANAIYNMELRSDDIFVASYQRSGTTWTQELVWLVANNLDYAKAQQIPLMRRYPFLEAVSFFNSETQNVFRQASENSEKVQKAMEAMSQPATELLAVEPSPRFVKTHLPMSLLSPKLLNTAKVVYVARDPRDVVVSCYHHSRLLELVGFNDDFKKFWNLFINDLFMLTPYFEHVKEAWDKRDDPNMLFLFYEELSKDLPASIRRVAKFLGKDVTDDQMPRLCDHLSIENFKKNKSVNAEDMREFNILSSKETFIRKGKTGGWREYFDEEMTQQAERWIADNLRNTDLRFPSMEENK